MAFHRQTIDEMGTFLADWRCIESSKSEFIPLYSSDFLINLTQKGKSRLYIRASFFRFSVERNTHED
jgi:hypothetical protein